jgi:hypothetical protein
LISDAPRLALEVGCEYSVKRGRANYSMSKSEKNKGQTKESIDQVTSMPDFYEDFRPEEINEIFFTESVQRDRNTHHENLWFFTRC